MPEKGSQNSSLQHLFLFFYKHQSGVAAAALIYGHTGSVHIAYLIKNSGNNKVALRVHSAVSAAFFHYSDTAAKSIGFGVFGLGEPTSRFKIIAVLAAAVKKQHTVFRTGAGIACGYGILLLGSGHLCV